MTALANAPLRLGPFPFRDDPSGVAQTLLLIGDWGIAVAQFETGTPGPCISNRRCIFSDWKVGEPLADHGEASSPVSNSAAARFLGRDLDDCSNIPAAKDRLASRRKRIARLLRTL